MCILPSYQENMYMYDYNESILYEHNVQASHMSSDFSMYQLDHEFDESNKSLLKVQNTKSTLCGCFRCLATTKNSFITGHLGKNSIAIGFNFLFP